MLRDAEMERIVTEVIPDILARLEALEEACCCEEATTVVEEKDGVYAYGVSPDGPATSSV